MFLCDETERAKAQFDALAGLVAGLDPADIPLRGVAALVDVFTGIERLGGAARTLLAERLAESEVWKREGHPSAAEYMALKTGSTAQSARNTLATSKRLKELPQTESALRRGDLSCGQADAIADAAVHDPSVESDLLGMAETASLMELRQECLRRKAQADPDPEATRRRIHKNRKVRTHTDGEGAWNIYGRGPLDVGADVSGALDLICDELFRKARAEGRREARDAYMFDALQILARWGWDIYYGDTPTWDFAEPDNGDAGGTTGDRTGADSVASGMSGNDAGESVDANRGDAPVAGEAVPARFAGDGIVNGTGEAGAVTSDHPASSRVASHDTRADHARTDHTSRASYSDRTSDGDGGVTGLSRFGGDDRSFDGAHMELASRDAGGAVAGDLLPLDGQGRGTGSSASSAGRREDMAETLVGPGRDDHGGNRAQRRQHAKKHKGKQQASLKRLVLVQVSLAALVRGRVEAGERCEMPGRGPLDVATVAGMLPDAIVKLVVGSCDQVACVAHLGRGLELEQLVPTAAGLDRTPDSPPTAGSRSSKPRYLILVHVDPATLSPPGDGEHVDVPGVGPVAHAALQQLMADRVIERLVGSAVDVTELSHQGRGLNTAQLVAALWVQPLCSVQGCNRYRVEYDHRDPWASVRTTSLDNIDPLCAHHHALKSTLGWALVDGVGKRAMVPPDHPRHPANRATAPADRPDHATLGRAGDVDASPRSPERPAALVGSAA